MWRRLIKPQAVGSTPRAFPEPGSLAAPLAAPTAAAEAAAPTAPGASDPDLHDPTDPMNWPEASRDFEITQEMIDRMRAKDPELVESIAKLDLMEQDTPMVLSDVSFFLLFLMSCVAAMGMALLLPPPSPSSSRSHPINSFTHPHPPALTHTRQPSRHVHTQTPNTAHTPQS